jgi:hypothetical protein
MKGFILCILVIFSCKVEGQNDYFNHYTRQISPGITLVKNKGQMLQLISGIDTLNCGSYFIYQSAIYANTKNAIIRLEKNGSKALNKEEIGVLNHDIIWKRNFNYYHGFPSLLTVILCIPTLLFFLLPLAMKGVNVLLARHDRPMFIVRSRYWLLSLLLLGWVIEIYLRFNPQSF